MSKLAFATHANHPGIDADDKPLVQQLEQMGHRCAGVPWNADVDWSDFDGVLIRSTWDYHLSPQAFESWIRHLESLGLPVWNPTPTLRWNMHKGYLLELETVGVPIIPTEIIKAGGEAHIADLLARHDWGRAVLKPANSLGADDTILISRDDTSSGQKLAERVLVDRDLLVQRFQPQIESEGEWSLIFIDGTYSHCILKSPPAGEFRVQEHLGARFDLVQPPDSLIGAAQLALERSSKEWAYARVDGIVDEGQFLLMELELLEPTLFFVDYPAAAKHLARRIDADVKGN